jgi:hypothetical protein
MKKVGISADLERRIRAAEGEHKLLGELVKLLGEAGDKRAAGSKPSGLGYKDLVALFRFHLGDLLVVPMNPSTRYIIRLVNTARDLGITPENVEQICTGLRKTYPRGPYQLDFVVRRADVHYENGKVDSNSTGDSVRSGVVYSGRPVFDD